MRMPCKAYAMFSFFLLLHWRSAKTLSQTVTNVQNWIWETLVYLAINVATSQTHNHCKSSSHLEGDTASVQGRAFHRAVPSTHWSTKRPSEWRLWAPLQLVLALGAHHGELRILPAMPFVNWDEQEQASDSDTEWVASESGSEQREPEAILHFESGARVG